MNPGKHQSDAQLERIVLDFESHVAASVRAQGYDLLHVTHYGAKDIDPRYLVVWICVRTDADKTRLNADVALLAGFRNQLAQFGYPAHVIDNVHIGAESQQTVDLESNGNWWLHWK